MKPPKIDSVQLAKFILAKQGPMEHLKLQKLVYYVEAWHLAYFGESIIEDKFKAWMHGPVSLKVWHEFKHSTQTLLNEIKIPAREKELVIEKISDILKPDQLSLIDDVLREYGPLTAYQLEGLTHSEQPWLEARNGIPAAQVSNAVISKETMRKFYHKRLYGTNAAKE
jgi:uncharacterized phage-associated protein